VKGDPQAVAERLGLRRAGSEFKGPCPICGGTDRFHVRPGRSAGFLVHCRYGCTFAEIARELESRGLTDRDEYQAPRYRTADLEYCDHFLLVMDGAIRRGEGISQGDFEAIARLVTKVDPQRAKKLLEKRNRLWSKNENV